MKPGTESQPLRVAVIGAGPAGFYVVDHLFKQEGLVVTVDLFDRLPTPHGLVRHGVAPDHQKIKQVTKVFDKVAQNPGFRFFGNVELGKHLRPEAMRDYYHQIVYTVGAQTDRNLDIPGENLAGSHSATEFVAWYNGHPDYQNRHFDLSQENVAIVGVGNVAVDVARILCRTVDELAVTDIADEAIEALRHSRVRQVYMLGRRGLAQAAFSVQEIKELGNLDHAQVRVLPDEAEPDELTRSELERNPNQTAQKKIQILQDFAVAPHVDKPRTLTIRFLVSPVELIGDTSGHVCEMRLVKNTLQITGNGTLRPQATEVEQRIPVGLVFRSVGYRGVPLDGVPFHTRWGVIPNKKGRIHDPDASQHVVGEYVAGWIKRGPTGLIGTNKADAVETVTMMLGDLAEGRILNPAQPGIDECTAWIAGCQSEYFSFDDWRKLDAYEVNRGKQTGRPRVKLTSVAEMLAVRNEN